MGMRFKSDDGNNNIKPIKNNNIKPIKNNNIKPIKNNNIKPIESIQNDQTVCLPNGPIFNIENPNQCISCGSSGYIP